MKDVGRWGGGKKGRRGEERGEGRGRRGGMEGRKRERRGGEERRGGGEEGKKGGREGGQEVGRYKAYLQPCMQHSLHF